VVVEAWRIEYNTYRPHSSLGGLTPVEFKRPWIAEDPPCSSRVAQVVGPRYTHVSSRRPGNGRSPLAPCQVFDNIDITTYLSGGRRVRLARFSAQEETPRAGLGGGESIFEVSGSWHGSPEAVRRRARHGGKDGSCVPPVRRPRPPVPPGPGRGRECPTGVLGRPKMGDVDVSVERLCHQQTTVAPSAPGREPG
jgi:hypothetical protein